MTIQFNDGFALVSGEVTVYIADNQGIYSRSAQEFVAEGTGLSAGAYLDAPPEPKDNFAIVRSDDGLRWEYEPDYRGQTYYNTTTGEAIIINELGEIPQNLTALKPLDTPCKWDGEKWVIDEEKRLAQIKRQQDQVWEQIKQERTRRIGGGVYVEELGKWFHTDYNSKLQYSTLKNQNTLPTDLEWKTMDNTFVKLNKDSIEIIINEIIKKEQHDFKNAGIHHFAVYNTDKPLEYDYSTGWSDIYEE